MTASEGNRTGGFSVLSALSDFSGNETFFASAAVWWESLNEPRAYRSGPR